MAGAVCLAPALVLPESVVRTSSRWPPAAFVLCLVSRAEQCPPGLSVLSNGGVSLFRVGMDRTFRSDSLVGTAAFPPRPGCVERCSEHRGADAFAT